MASPLPKDVHQEFAMETDSLVVAYSFSGEAESVTMGIFNPLETPLFVNWRNSALILNQKSTPLVMFKGLDSEVVPPKSMVLIEVPLEIAFVPELQNDPVAEKHKYYADNGEIFSVVLREYNQNTSPLKLRMHLVVGNNEAFQNAHFHNHYFFVQQITEHKSVRSALAIMTYENGPKKGQLKPDRFSVASPNNPDEMQGWAIFGVLAAVALAILTNVQSVDD